MYDLAARCGVAIGAACDRAGIARSTPPRWRNGTKPRPHQVMKLQRAIIQLARENGTLPAEMVVLGDSGVTCPPDVLSEIATIIAAVGRLSAALERLGYPTK
ncbi:MAG TPA: hypothetical protein VGE09_11090 [Pseudoxanthomonas sp.]